MKLKLINITDMFISALIVGVMVFSLRSTGIKTDIILFGVGMFIVGKIIGMVSMTVYMVTKFNLWKK